MKNASIVLAFAACFVLSGCATPPKANPALVESGCAQSCSSNLATCSSGFKMFPIVQQKQCNDTYDVCIKGCPPRGAAPSDQQAKSASVAERLKNLENLYSAGSISKEEYEAKRKEILGSL